MSEVSPQGYSKSKVSSMGPKSPYYGGDILTPPVSPTSKLSNFSEMPLELHETTTGRVSKFADLDDFSQFGGTSDQVSHAD